MNRSFVIQGSTAKLEQHREKSACWRIILRKYPGLKIITQVKKTCINTTKQYTWHKDSLFCHIIQSWNLCLWVTRIYSCILPKSKTSLEPLSNIVSKSKTLTKIMLFWAYDFPKHLSSFPLLIHSCECNLSR